MDQVYTKGKGMLVVSTKIPAIKPALLKLFEKNICKIALTNIGRVNRMHTIQAKGRGQNETKSFLLKTLVKMWTQVYGCPLT